MEKKQTKSDLISKEKQQICKINTFLYSCSCVSFSLFKLDEDNNCGGERKI